VPSPPSLPSRMSLVDARAAKPRIVLWEQIVLGLALFGYYLVVDGLHSAGRRTAADAHGQAIFDLERSLHLDIEKSLNDWLAPHVVLRTIANYEYAYTYILSAIAALVFLLWRHPEIYRRARTSFVLVTGIGITCFWLYPTTPPRMLPGNTFFDTVTHGHTFGSWGSFLVTGANQLAAMPSLHMGWALWVSVVLAWAGVRRWLQVLSAIHVLVTLFVIMSTANHFLLDAVAAFVLVVAADRVALWIHPPWEGSIVPAADAFFLHVEDSGDPQIVGGFVIYEYAAGQPSLEAVRQVVAGELDRLPRFTQRITQPGRWRRPRWVMAPPLDWSWHVISREVPDRAGMHAAVAELVAEPFPRDRPLWRLALLEQPDGHRAFVILMHHAIADGIGTVTQVLNLLRPRVELPAPPQRPTVLQTGLATAVGFAQLATDGGNPKPLGRPSGRRAFATAGLPMSAVKEAAAGRRITDLVLALTAGAVADVHPELVERAGGRLRVAVPLMVRAPGDAAEGNATAAVMVDLPLRAAPTEELYDEIATRTARLRTPTRALASRWVMARLLRCFPEPMVGWFARTVYGGRFFHGIVSNMPGPTQQLTMADVVMAEVYPVLPLAPGAPFVLGALSWTGVLGLGLATDPALVDADRVSAAMVARLDAIALSPRPAPAASGTAPVASPVLPRTASGAAPADS
jgi:diacylglycerol O-acyltransferase / wax synthase